MHCKFMNDKIIEAIKALGFINIDKSKYARTIEYCFEHRKTKKRYAVYKTGYVRSVNTITCQMIYSNISTQQDRLEKLLKYLTKIKRLKRI